MRRMLITSVAVFAGIFGWTGSAGAGFISSTVPVIAIIAGDLFLGEAEGSLDESGTLRVQSRANLDVTCHGQFTSSVEPGGAGTMRCSDGITATYQFQRLGIARGYGSGISSHGSMSFTYGLSANESASYLKLPRGKALRLDGKDLVLVDARQSVAPATETAPDALLSAATFVVTTRLRQDQTNSPEKIAELVESTILPLFDFRRMTRLAVARSWRLASPEQQNALVIEFRTLLVRTYSTALTTYRGQAIEYKALRAAPGATDVTVKSVVPQSGAEPTTIDYDMERTPAGWKVYDIKISNISLITTYRSTFARIIRDDGVDGLIQTLSARNQRTDVALRPRDGVVLPIIFMRAVIPGVLRSGQ